MSNEDEAVDPTTPEEDLAASAPEEIQQPEPVETRTQVEVGLERSVRYLRIMLVFAGIGAVVAAVAALFFPVAEDADYELGQVVGLMLVVGAVVGLTLGALLALLLGLVAKRSKGAAIAVQTDVR